MTGASKRGPSQAVADIYCRVSLDATGEELAVSRQEAECRELAERLGMTVGRVFVDNDISATKGKRRPQFEEVLADPPGALIVWHIDRLVRLSRDLERVLETGMAVHAVTSGHVDLSTPAGRAVARTITAWSQYEGEQKAERQRSSNAQRARAGKQWWPTRPFGFYMDATHHPIESAALKVVYEALLSGSTLASQARWLNDKGLPTPRGDNPWTGMTLRPVVLNARNAGIRVYRGEEVGPAAWEPIVDEQTYRSVARALSDPSRSTGGGGRTPRSLLTGLANCAVCGGVIRLGGRKYGGRRYEVYVCRGKHCLSLHVAPVDDIVLNALASFMLDPERKELWQRDTTGNSAALFAEERTVLLQLTEWAEDRTEGRVTRSQFLTATERLTARLEVVRAALGAHSPVPEELRDIPDTTALVEKMRSIELDRARHTVEMMTTGIALRPVGRGNRSITEKHVVVLFREWDDAPERVVWGEESGTILLTS